PPQPPRTISRRRSHLREPSHPSRRRPSLARVLPPRGPPHPRHRLLRRHTAHPGEARSFLKVSQAPEPNGPRRSLGLTLGRLPPPRPALCPLRPPPPPSRRSRRAAAPRLPRATPPRLPQAVLVKQDPLAPSPHPTGACPHRQDR